MLWVTRHNPHVDRCASAWLIRRFIDKEARFAFVSKDDPMPNGAIAFFQLKPQQAQPTTSAAAPT